MQENNKKTEKSNNEKEIKKKRKRIRKIKRLSIRFVIIIIFIFILLQVSTFRVVHNNDMYPMLCDGQGVIVLKIKEPLINEVVLYKQNGQKKFGRIIAQENDDVKITEEGLFINGNVIYNSLPYETKPNTQEEIHLKVPVSSYYLLNDYRERTNDSRTFGAIPKEDVIGVVIFTIKYREI